MAVACRRSSRPAALAPEAWTAVPEEQGSILAPGALLVLGPKGIAVPDGGCGIDAGDCAAVASTSSPVAVEFRKDALLLDVAPGLRVLREARGTDRPICIAARDPHRAGRCIRARLFTEDDFHAWLDGQTSESKLRVVMRSDGMEVAGAGGKVPGPDRYGPSILPVDGRPDFVRLDDVMRRLAAQVPDEHEAGILASAATPFDDVARAAAAVAGPSGARFDRVFIVIP